MKLKWDKEARQLVDTTAQYIEEQDGAIAGADFLEEVMHVVRLLPLVPYLGPLERLLYRSKVKFRSIVVSKYNKIIYYVRQDEIVIVDFWDTRMNPKTLVKRLQNKL
jgi:plasmid stabilization system protein ParE